MFGGFDPRTRSLFFSRRRTVALLLATALYATVLGFALQQQAEEETVEVELEPEIKDFAVEEEPEPEPEEEPPPPPPPNTKVKVVKNPRPRPRPKIQQPIDKPTEAADETDLEKVVEVGEGATSAEVRGDRPVRKKPEKKPPPPEPKPEPKPETKKKLDPTKPIDRPENATMPKPEPGNEQPDYPKNLRDDGITGEVVLKIHIHRDGAVRGAKILRKRNSATTDDDKARANKLFIAAVIKVVKTWKYTPAKLNGRPISIWFPVTFPFKLTAG